MAAATIERDVPVGNAARLLTGTVDLSGGIEQRVSADSVSRFESVLAQPTAGYVFTFDPGTQTIRGRAVDEHPDLSALTAVRFLGIGA